MPYKLTSPVMNLANSPFSARPWVRISPIAPRPKRANPTLVRTGGTGMKIGEMSVADVADLLRGERAQILEQTEAPLMERALAAMVNALKQGQEARPPAEVPA